MLKKITLVTLFISCGLASAESVQNGKSLSPKVEPVKIHAIALEKISLFKCSPFPLCADYPDDDGSGGSVKAAFNNSVLVNKPK